MRPETYKYIYDAQLACQRVLQFLDGKSFEDYEADVMLQSAVERQLMIIGEALGQSRRDGELNSVVKNVRRIVNLRNVIVHGYAVMEARTVWGVIQKELPGLNEKLKALLSEK